MKDKNFAWIPPTVKDRGPESVGVGSETFALCLCSVWTGKGGPGVTFSTPSGSREKRDTLENRGDPHQTVKNCPLVFKMLVFMFGDHQRPLEGSGTQTAKLWSLGFRAGWGPKIETLAKPERCWILPGEPLLWNPQCPSQIGLLCSRSCRVLGLITSGCYWLENSPHSNNQAKT